MALGSLGTLSVIIRASTEEFIRQMRSVGETLERNSSKMKKIGKQMTTFVSLPLKLTGLAAIKTGAEFEAGMSVVQAVTGATADELDELESKAREIGKTTKFSAIQATEAMTYMGRAGWDTNQILSSLQATMNLAAASGEDLGLVTDIATDAMTALGMNASEVSSTVTPNAPAVGAAYLKASPSFTMSVDVLVVVAVNTSTNFVASFAFIPSAVIASVAISVTSPKSSPEAAAKFIVACRDESI